MSNYAIIALGGKQYRVREGEKLLVDRVSTDEGKTFHPDVLFTGGDGKAGSTDGSGGDYEFEPDPTAILESLLPRYVEARIYAALLNAAASEHPRGASTVRRTGRLAPSGDPCAPARADR